MNRSFLLSLALYPAVAFGQQGAWEPAFNFGDASGGFTVAVNLIHVWDGQTTKVLALQYNVAGTDRTRLWTPASAPGASGTYENVPTTDLLFCGGASAMADGRILHVGGLFVNDVNIFDPITAQWNNPLPPDMTFDRWYPTSTTLADGRMLVTGGWRCNPFNSQSLNFCNGADEFVRTPELYDPATNTWDLLWVADREQWIYPFMFVLPDGRIVDAGPTDTSFLDPATWTWSGSIPDPTYPNPLPKPPGKHGSAVMYEPGKIMRCAGLELGGALGPPKGVATTWVVDLTSDSEAGWLVAGDMHKRRANHNLVILPDGKVLALGGNRDYAPQGVPITPVFEAEIFDPASGTWSLQPPSDPLHERM